MTNLPKLLMFSMVDQYVAREYIIPLTFLLKNAFDITVVTYNRYPYDMLDDFLGEKLSFNYLAISDHYFDSIPRVERNKYVKLYGEDIDFAKILIHDVIANDYPLNRDFLYHNSLTFQKLYGFALRIENILRAINPDYIIVQQGSEPISRIIIS